MIVRVVVYTHVSVCNSFFLNDSIFSKKNDSSDMAIRKNQTRAKITHIKIHEILRVKSSHVFSHTCL